MPLNLAPSELDSLVSHLNKLVSMVMVTIKLPNRNMSSDGAHYPAQTANRVCPMWVPINPINLASSICSEMYGSG